MGWHPCRVAGWAANPLPALCPALLPWVPPETTSNSNRNGKFESKGTEQILSHCINEASLDPGFPPMLPNQTCMGHIQSNHCRLPRPGVQH